MSGEGPFGGDTKNPILFVSNTLDPATPMINGQTWSPRFKGSELLVIEGVGVSFLYFPLQRPMLYGNPSLLCMKFEPS
jgi:hypothetical protein